MQAVNCPRCNGPLTPWQWPYAECKVLFLSENRGCGLYRLDDDDGNLVGVPKTPPPDRFDDVRLGPLLTSVDLSNYADTTATNETLITMDTSQYRVIRSIDGGTLLFSRGPLMGTVSLDWPQWGYVA